ncbi:hypothetical protein B484DRAFT_435850, partial [Ochromonadaceae sp. CCMP2298]
MDEAVDRLWGGSKLILGPMVRASSLPLRLTALDFGADTVYSEEISAYRASLCQRVPNPIVNTVDFVEPAKRSGSNSNSSRGGDKGGDRSGGKRQVLFRTHQQREVDPGLLVLQLGTPCAVSAIRAASLFERDVAAIDVNMGCSKHYAVSAGKGSALMTRPE